MVKNKNFLFVAAFLMLSLFLVACGGGDNDGSVDDTDDNSATEGAGDGVGVGVTGQSDEFIIGVNGEIPTLDPHAVNQTAAAQVNAHVLSTLVNQDADLQIYPGLATSWEQLDELTWQFKLRDDVYFHNGDHMTARDVEFSLTRAAGAPAVTPVVGMIDPDKFEIIDDYTINIGTTYPFAPFLNHMAHNAAAILSADALGDVAPRDTEGREDELIVGTGPYQITENISGNRLVMERWDDYHGELPNIREITYLIIPDGQARAMRLETGDVDAIMSPMPTDVARLENLPGVTMHMVDGLGVEYVMLNNEHIPDVRVRQAINYALDVSQIVEVTTEGTFDHASGFINQITFGHNPDFEGYPYDVERARELMVEAGYSGEAGANDLELDFYANGENDIRTQSAEIIANQLREIGIDVSIHTPEFSAIMDMVEGREIAMATLGWGTVTGDADYALYPLFHSSAHSPSTNHALLDNPEVDDLLERARASADPEERLELYAEVQEILHEEAPWVLLSNTVVRIPAQNNVGGVVVMPHQSHYFGDIYFTE